MKADLILKNYEIAKERYAALGVDTDKAIETLEKTPISLHCWQADDVVGFERGEAASGGIQSTGNYPGKARNIDELRQDIEKVNSLLAGTFRLNLHEIYGEFGGKQIDRNEDSVDQFTGWMQWAKEQNMKLDFNSTSSLTLRVAVSHCQIPTQLFASSGLSTPSVAAALQTLWVSSRTTHVS